jgi:high-affinity Fe2+/Pb2+ permease
MLGIVAVIIGWAIALGVFSLADQHPSGSRWNTILTGVGLFFAFAGMFIGWQAHKHIRPAMRRNSGASKEI